MKTIKSIALLTFLLVATVSFAQDDKGETGDAKKEKSSRGTDPNIVSDEVMNVVGQTDAKAIRPNTKGGESRGGNCYTWFDNYTDWRITAYVDGVREGTIAPFGDGGVWVGTGTTKMYAVAYFNDGSKISWGPGQRHCGYGDEMAMEVYSGHYNLFVK